MATPPKPSDAVLAAMRAALDARKAKRDEPPDPALEADRLGKLLLAKLETALHKAEDSKDIVAAAAGLTAAMKFCGVIPTSGDASSDAKDEPPIFRIEFAEPDLPLGADRLDVPAKPEAASGQAHPFPALDPPDEDAEPGRGRRSA